MKPMVTTMRDTLNSSRSVVKTSQFTDFAGIRNITMTSHEVLGNIAQLQSKTDNARRVVLRSLTKNGYSAKVTSKLNQAVRVGDNYVLEIIVQAKVV